MRLFTALELPDEPRKHLARLIDFWKEHLVPALRSSRGIDAPPVSWVRDENLHITLKFVGEVPDADLPNVCAVLAGVEQVGLVTVNAARLEGLPVRGPIHTICAEITGNVERLGQLHDLVNRAGASLGLPRESRPFRPHITVGRLRRPLPAQVRSSLNKVADSQMPGPVFTVASLALIQSELLPSGPRYTPLARFPLDSGMVVIGVGKAG